MRKLVKKLFSNLPVLGIGGLIGIVLAFLGCLALWVLETWRNPRQRRTWSEILNHRPRRPWLRILTQRSRHSTVTTQGQVLTHPTKFG